MEQKNPDVERLEREVEGLQRVLAAREGTIKGLEAVRVKLEGKVLERQRKNDELCRQLKSLPPLKERLRATKTELKRCLKVLGEAVNLVE